MNTFVDTIETIMVDHPPTDGTKVYYFEIDEANEQALFPTHSLIYSKQNIDKAPWDWDKLFSVRDNERLKNTILRERVDQAVERGYKTAWAFSKLEVDIRWFVLAWKE